MKCPIDDTVLQMTDRQGIEIDYCPQCRGVWLDRGELDKIIDRSEDAPGPAPSQPPGPAYDERSSRPAYDERSSRPSYPRSSSDYDDRRHGGYYKKRKKESFLGELFDF